jgi:hypothetical protein
MAVMLGDLYDAPVSANVDQDKARKAAAEVENRIVGVEAKLDRLGARVTLLAWMIGTNMALTLAVIGLLMPGIGSR